MVIDIRDDEYNDGDQFSAEVLAVLYRDNKRLFAVTAMLDGAPWYALVHEDSDAIADIGGVPL